MALAVDPCYGADGRGDLSTLEKAMYVATPPPNLKRELWDSNLFSKLEKLLEVL